MNKLFIGLVVFTILFAACNSNTQNEGFMNDEDIDMSDELLMGDESVLTDMPEYSKLRGGESETYDRSFENAPPLIPHRVGGFLPISIDDNRCMLCHMPNKAAEFNAVPLPKTHFTSYRPLIIEEDGKFRVDVDHDGNEVVETDLEHFNGAMYNCSQCHVPQAEVTVEIPNTFDPDYRSNSNKSKSNLKTNMGEGVR